MISHEPAVFVHGNRETSAVWGPLLGELARADVVCLSPPGFGAPLPAGFGATMDDYRDWLIARLEAFRDPVDLVGHDWGGAHVLNAVAERAGAEVVTLEDVGHWWMVQDSRLGAEVLSAFWADLP